MNLLGKHGSVMWRARSTASNALGVALIGILFYGRLGGAPDAADYDGAFGVALVYLTVAALVAALLRCRVVPQLRAARPITTMPLP
ncbi:hypothetical protein J2W34_004414 [Variovorax boronicumulans]|uniref:hypothetical protein n=1 Tax=Variovorax boronicumulans TaxID=436515 RepID=UPI002788312E|nr:hypothetical protein [Variovorax boronicumulans]MDQ0072609.1 hypothetical protein [Variovorax boronicumulans]